MERTEQLIIAQLKAGKEEAYKFLYDNHYPILCHIAAQYVHDDFLAETISGDVIFHIWEIRETLSIDTTIRGYLVRSVRNRCLDYLKSQYNRNESVLSSFSSDFPVLGYVKDDEYPLGRLLAGELEEEIMKAIERLPEECRHVFKMSRFDGKKNNEIAAETGISINTVKYHIKRALTLLHEDLNKYLTGIIALIFSNL